MDLFTLVGKIVLDADGFSEKIDSVMAKVESMGSGIHAAGEKISHIGSKLTLGVTTPIMGMGAAAIKTAANFESTMSQVSAISGATGSDFQKLENLAKEMGETTKFSASQAAEALTYMAMAGWKTDDMLSGLPGIMNLAAASGEDLALTSDIVTDALTAFGMSASESGHFADLIAKASSNANTNVAMMGETFKYVAPVAGSLGYSADDVALAIGLMANSGIKASQAGTSLRASLTNLVKPTEDMQKVMVSLGLATVETANVVDEGKLYKAQSKVENKTLDMEKAQIKYNDAVAKYGANSTQAQTAALNLEKAKNNLEDAMHDLSAAQEGENENIGIQNELLVDSAGNMKSFREVLSTLRAAFKGLSEEEQAQAAATLFGKEAMSGMLAVINASDSDFNKLAEAIDSADGAAQDMADTMNDNLSGQITLLKSQLEALAIQFVTLIMPYLRQGVEWLSELCTWISGLDDGTKKMIMTIAGIAAAAGPVLIIGGKIISGIGTLITAGSKLIGGIGSVISVGKTLFSGGVKIAGGIGSLVTKLGSALLPALAAVPAPVWIIIGVIGALVAAGVALYKNWDEVKAFCGKAWDGIKNIIGAAAEKIKGFFQGIMDFIGNNWQGLLLLIVNPVAGGFKLLYDNCETFRNFIDGFLGNLKEGFQNFKDNIVGRFTELKDSIVEKAHELKERVNEKWDQMKDKAHEMVEGIKERYHGMADDLKQKTDELKTAVVERYHEIKENAVAKFEEMKEQAGEKFNELKEKATAKVEELRVQASEKIQNLRDNALSHFEELKEKTSTKVSEMREKVVTDFYNMKEQVSEKISDLKERWGQRFEEAREKIISETTELKEQATARIEEFREAAVNKVNDFKDSAIRKFNEFKDESVSKLSEVAAKGVEGFNTIREKGSAAIENLKNTAVSKFAEMGNTVRDKFSDVGTKIIDTFSRCREIIHDIVEKIKGFFNFEWKLPDIKLPHFKIDGSFSLNPPSIPHFGVDWYAQGGVMTKPTAFGINPATGNIMAGGEAGAEAIAPITILQDYIRSAVAERDEGLVNTLNTISMMLSRYLPQIAQMKLVLDTGATVGALASGMNVRLGEISRQDERIK